MAYTYTYTYTNMCLKPISKQEKEKLVKNQNDTEIYAIYISPFERRKEMALEKVSENGLPLHVKYPFTLEGTEKAYFMRLSEEEAQDATEVPTYKVSFNQSGRIGNYQLLNATYENGLFVSLEDVIQQKFIIPSKETINNQK